MSGHLKIILQLLILTITIDLKKCVEREEEQKEALFLSPYIKQGNISVARSLSQVIHDDFMNVTSYSGLITVDEGYDSHMFFWYFPPMEASMDKAPLILWLEGGPGLSGLVGLFYGNGPFELVGDDTLIKRESSWNKNYNILYLDNPVGVGFSCTNDDGYSMNQTSIAINLYSFLHQFLQMFPELQTSELYLIGESYGAKYAINLCSTIHRKNQEGSLHMNLKGFGLFSGYFDPINQMNYGTNLYNLGLVDKPGMEKLHKHEEKVKKLIDNSQWEEEWYQAGVMESKFFGTDSIIYNLTGYQGYYNLRKPNEDPNLLINCMSTIEDYIGRIKVPLHLGTRTMNNQLNTVVNKLIPDILRSSAAEMSELLDHYRGVVATGQLDIIVSYPLMNNVLNKLNFSCADTWTKGERFPWYTNGKISGYYKTVCNLTEVLVLNSGHTIPTDQPERANHIVKFLVKNSWS